MPVSQVGGFAVNCSRHLVLRQVLSASDQIDRPRSTERHFTKKGEKTKKKAAIMSIFSVSTGARKSVFKASSNAQK